MLLPKVVGRSAPFQRTTDPLTKFEPLSVRVKAGPPAITEAGLRLEMMGRELVMMKLTALGKPAPRSRVENRDGRRTSRGDVTRRYRCRELTGCHRSWADRRRSSERQTQ